jgi:hypothetical protein
MDTTEEKPIALVSVSGTEDTSKNDEEKKKKEVPNDFAEIILQNKLKKERLIEARAAHNKSVTQSYRLRPKGK